MQMQWDKIQLPILRGKLREVQNQEQTQEVCPSEAMPDIGSILCGWGQPLLRSKEWQDDRVSISGGVMASILYAPEDGSVPRSVEAWLPFQMSWAIPQGQRDGTIRTDIALRSVDARVLSARKLLVRAQVSVLAEGLEPDDGRYISAQVSEPSIQVLQRSYPLVIPVEAGEKNIRLEEDLTLTAEDPQKLIGCTVQPEIEECRVVGDKAILRGECHVQALYFSADDEIHSDALSIPFAQYAQLEREYDKESTICVMPVVVNLEQEMLDGVLRVKCAFTAQYVVLERTMVQVAQDAYSLTDRLELKTETTQLPTVLDTRKLVRQIDKDAPCPYSRVIDATCFREQPILHRSGEQVDVEVPAMVQLLCRADDGSYAGVHVRFADQWSIPVGADASIGVTTAQPVSVQASGDAENVSIHLDLAHTVTATVEQPLSMISEIEVCEKLPQESERPSLILRRAGNESLWELAKSYGSTVEDIQNANSLEQDAPDGRLLLIPIH